MKDLRHVKAKIAKERRFTRSVSLPLSIWERINTTVTDNGLNMCDVVEEALRLFYADLPDSNTMPEGTAQ